MPSYPVFNWNPDYSMVESIGFSTEITVFESGVEQRRKEMANGLRTFKLNYNLLDQDEADDIWEFFIERAGKYDPFLYRDFLNDYLIENEEPSGVKNGLNTTFSLSKKLIVKPTDADFSPPSRDVEIYKNGILLVEGADYVLDYSSGTIEFTVGPLASDKITATYEFYYLVRFLEDKMSKDLFEYTVYRTGLSLKELHASTVSAGSLVTSFFKPLSGSDDGYDGDGCGFEASQQILYICEYYPNQRTFIRFPNVTIPQGASITSAILRFQSHQTFTQTTVNVDIYGNDVDDAVAPTDSTEFDNLVLTSNKIDWNNLPGWTMDHYYNSPDITDVVQEIVNRSGWSSGNALQIILIGGGEVWKPRLAAAYEHVSRDMPELHISWFE